jgi:hypothetical protein
MTIIKKFEPEQQKKKFPKTYIVLTAIGLFTLIMIEIWASNSAVAYGEKFEQLSDAAKNLQMENTILENEIAKQASLASIASKSAQLGFSSDWSIQYIR